MESKSYYVTLQSFYFSSFFQNWKYSKCKLLYDLQTSKNLLWSYDLMVRYYYCYHYHYYYHDHHHHHHCYYIICSFQTTFRKLQFWLSFSWNDNVKCSWSNLCCLLCYINCPKYIRTYKQEVKTAWHTSSCRMLDVRREMILTRAESCVPLPTLRRITSRSLFNLTWHNIQHKWTRHNMDIISI